MIGLFQTLLDEGAREEEIFAQIRERYGSLEDPEKEALFLELIEKVEILPEKISPLLNELNTMDPDDPDWPRRLAGLRSRLYSPRLLIFRKISHAPGGLRFLLDFRRDLLSAQRFSGIDLKALDFDIVLLFELWFQEGFLYLEEITHDSSYRQIELIKNSDLVHPMMTIEEMGLRLGRDRRCFALYHRLIPYEPIVFIEVALSNGLVRRIADIIENEGNQAEEGEKDTAVFYSINSTQQGLSGLGLGKMLIGQVVDYLKKDRPEIQTFATLSPITGFWKYYLRPLLEGKDENFSLKQSEFLSFFSKKQAQQILAKARSSGQRAEDLPGALLTVLSGEDWIRDEELKKSLRTALVKTAYHYIAREKNPQGKPLNPVAGFHLGNGATVSQKNVNFLANPTPRGLRDSCGLMVNYIYTSTWLGHLRRSLRWFEKTEFRNLFSRGR
ncbi:MAG: malonyl-CoA decarboxylase family protein [Deltaproteobacteria bacterium]|nr:malonyl-CoA decarboxylase family protein [Deltaproteobacteria bacterium]MBW2127814.1 malonyl-CoA decarboxylase family protein [Deltaproteobacteria bacterium]MBW2302098.1 malonyl-CoA decarboxylase family protein [Deltaproteobacteria bacterium]